MVTARPEAAQGNFATLTSRFSFCACVSVRPHQATSGSVKTTAGMALGSKATLCPAMASTAVRPSCDGLVREHGLADYIADRVDGGIVGLQLLVHLNETARADLHPRFVEAGDLGVRLASDGNQHTIENFLLRVAVLRFERRADAGAFVLDRRNGGVEQDSLEQLFQSLVQRKHEIAIRAGEQAREHFNDRDARAQRGVDGAEFEADVSAADDQQSAGNIFEIQGAGGIHHARRVELQRGNNRRARTGRDDDAIESERFCRAVGFRDAQGGGVFKRCVGPERSGLCAVWRERRGRP